MTFDSDRMLKKSASSVAGLPGFLVGRRTTVLLLVALTAVVSQCGRSPGPGTGMLEVRVKDHREAIDDFSALRLTIGALRLSPEPILKSDDPGWIDLVPEVREFDLVRYKDGDSLLIYEGKQAPRRFAAVDLRVDETEGVLAKTNAPATIENDIRPIRIEFATEPDIEVSVVLDLEVLDVSDHPGRGYVLYVRGYELYADGELVEKVPPG